MSTRNSRRGSPVSSLSKPYIFSAMYKTICKGFRQLFQPAEIPVPVFSFFINQDIQSMVKIIQPLGAEPIAPDPRRLNNFVTFYVPFSNEMEMSAQFFFQRF